MATRIIFATGNEGKMREIREILKGLNLEIVSMKEAGIERDAEETGTTFEENALIKARSIAGLTYDIVMADDSGLEIDALNKEPGIYSARYLGEDTSYDIKNTTLLNRMKAVPEPRRTARFVCALAAILPTGEELVVRGEVEGRIAYEMKGKYGFGYDPIFYLPQYGCTSAELLPEKKNAISHRGKALTQMYKLLSEREI